MILGVSPLSPTFTHLCQTSRIPQLHCLLQPKVCTAAPRHTELGRKPSAHPPLETPKNHKVKNRRVKHPLKVYLLTVSKIQLGYNLYFHSCNVQLIFFPSALSTYNMKLQNDLCLKRLNLEMFLFEKQQVITL